jgi:hypothetical protein
MGYKALHGVTWRYLELHCVIDHLQSLPECPADLPVRLARQTCPADLPGRLARQTCPADLPGRLARQTCPADLPGRLNMQFKKRGQFSIHLDGCWKKLCVENPAPSIQGENNSENIGRKFSKTFFSPPTFYHPQAMKAASKATNFLISSRRI